MTSDIPVKISILSILEIVGLSALIILKPMIIYIKKQLEKYFCNYLSKETLFDGDEARAPVSSPIQP